MTDLIIVLTTMPDDERADALARTLVDEQLAACVHVLDAKPLAEGNRFQYGGVAFETLAPALDYIPDTIPRNNDSLVLRVSFGERSLILSGDMERQIESELVRRNHVAHADVLKVAHHGSKTSTTVPFLDAVHPAFAIISAGFENLYGHPHRDIIERLNERKIGILRTDQIGLITIRTDGHRLVVETRGVAPAP